MAFVTMEDMNGSFEMTVFPNIYASSSHLLEVDTAILVDGQVQKDEKFMNNIGNFVCSIETQRVVLLA